MCVLQVIWTSGKTNCLHTDMDVDVVARLRALIRSQESPSSNAAAAAAAALSAEPLETAAAVKSAAATPQNGVHQQHPQQQSASNSVFAAGSAAGAPAEQPATDGEDGLASAAASRATSWISPNIHVSASTEPSTRSSTPYGHLLPAAAEEPGNSSGGSSKAGSIKGSGSGVSGWTIIPDTPSSSFQKWAGPLVEEGVRLFADLPAWMAQ